jgi:PAS domain S-box-containing protein
MSVSFPDPENPQKPQNGSPSSPSVEARLETGEYQRGERFRLLVENARDYAMFTQDAQGRINSWNIGAERILGWKEAEIIGQLCNIIFTPEDRAAGEPERERATAREKGRAEDERWHVRKDGSRFWASGVMTLLTDEVGVFLGFAKVLRDLTERKRLEDELRHAKDELEQRVKERTQELTELRRGQVARMEEERRRLSRELHDQTGQHLSGLGIHLGSMERAANATREAARLAAQAANEAARAAREAATASEIAAQVAAKTDSTAEAGHLARVASEAARTAAIAATDAGAAAGAADAALAVVEVDAPRLAQLRALTDSLTHDLHRIAVDLRPYSLDDLGLVAALGAYALEWGERTDIPAELESIGLEEAGDTSRRLSSEVETALYRIVQEALTNVAKHAPTATSVSITLQRLDGQVQATVEDDGPGFDPETAGVGRLGLAGMRERATLLGGTLEVESAPGSGTTIYARLPVQ